MENTQNSKTAQLEISDLITDIKILQRYEKTLLQTVVRMTSTCNGKKPTLEKPNDVTSMLVIEYDQWFTLLEAAMCFACESQTIISEIDQIVTAFINEQQEKKTNQIPETP